MLAAATAALETGRNTCSPTSGFHHAGWSEFDKFGYFCTFNGLVVTATLIKDRFKVGKIGIVDLDHHDGNGTRDILESLGLDYVRHYTFGKHNVMTVDNGIRIPSNYHWRGGIWARRWLDGLADKLQEFEDCDLILYQAGADPHKDDPYGGALSTDQLRRRDEIVFSKFADLGIPVAWNLAGGYQRPIEKVLELHMNTALECLKFVK